MWEFEIWQEGLVVASGSGPDDRAVEREAMHYFNQYAQDGPACMMFGRSPLPSQRAKMVGDQPALSWPLPTPPGLE